MGRMSDEDKSQFKLLGTGNDCYFCGGEKKGYDTTPHRSMLDRAPESMERVRVAVCAKCGQRIHYANIVLNHATKREGAPLGLMTLEAKTRLCSNMPWQRSKGGTPKFVLQEDGLIVPGLTTVDGDTFYVDGKVWSLAEMRSVQGPMALRMVGANTSLVEECFWSLVVADEATKVIDVDKCKAILEI
jgi:hypothetical protein